MRRKKQWHEFIRIEPSVSELYGLEASVIFANVSDHRAYSVKKDEHSFHEWHRQDHFRLLEFQDDPIAPMSQDDCVLTGEHHYSSCFQSVNGVPSVSVTDLQSYFFRAYPMLVLRALHLGKEAVAMNTVMGIIVAYRSPTAILLFLPSFRMLTLRQTVLNIHRSFNLLWSCRIHFLKSKTDTYFFHGSLWVLQQIGS